jgi:hypothetical protein
MASIRKRKTKQIAMRTIILLLIFSFQANSQTHSPTMQLTWLGNGVIQIDNQMNCDATTRVAFIGLNHSTDTLVLIKANTIVYYSLMPFPIEVKVKSDGSCHTHGWISIRISQTLNIQDTRVRPPYHTRKFFDLFISDGKLVMTGTYRDVVQWAAYSSDGRLLGKGVSKVGSVQLPRKTALVNVNSSLFKYSIKTIL